MKEKEAIEYLEITKTCSEDNSVGELQKQMCDIAIRALGEIQQYREIGTVEDFERLAYLKNATKMKPTITVGSMEQANAN